jgi:protein TonB
MFEQTFVQTQARRPWTVGVSLTVQCGVVLLLLLIPLLHPETLGSIGPPKTRLISTWINLPPPPPAAAHAVAHPAATLTAPAHPRPFFLYPVVPTHTTSVASVAVPLDEAMPSAWAGSVGSSVGPALTSALPPPVAPVVPKPVISSGPVRVSQGVEGAKLVFSPRPEYPRMAQITHSQGLVKLEAIIGADGKIRDLRVLSGSPLLVNAALDAVKQWRYQPTLLNGVPVEVVTEIEVNFTLTR